MKVEINLYATLARYLPEKVRENDCMMEVKNGTTVGELRHRLKPIPTRPPEPSLS